MKYFAEQQLSGLEDGLRIALANRNIMQAKMQATYTILHFLVAIFKK